ncbi:DinB family protein [Paeniglutamicibacter gangotriensis]|uniref:DinB family protein n=1 Tax=Paeniglutamicibacter gangotriensis TaxID=254787 RepID=A0A5B0EF40_9MICC|nr:DinB family protein [Paeniglutamicibacter gangotriensis]
MKPDVSTQPALDPSPDPPRCGSERQTLRGFLACQRRTLQMKCAGLSATALGTCAVPPSGLSLLVLVRHLSDVERFWVRSCLAGKQAPPLYWGKDGTETDFDFPAPDAQLVELSFTAWKEEMAHADVAFGAAPLERTVAAGHHGTVSVRWILTHLIEEYSRHHGHAGLLRECLDGTVGE